MKTRDLLILGFLVAFGTTLLQAAPIPTDALYTNKPRFRIPYRYDAAEIRRLGSREIRLYASLDQGRQWQHMQSVEPQTGRFEFQATRDGEYWFAVRTIDAQGRPFPGGNTIEPGLKVIVDTTNPQLNLNLKQASPGKVRLEWSSVDSSIDPESLELEFIQPGETNWQKVSVFSNSEGQTEWSVPQGGGVAVRGLIKDRAGNEGRAQIQVQIEPASEAVPKPTVPDFRQPIASTKSKPTPSSMSLPGHFPQQSISKSDPFSVQTLPQRKSQPDQLIGYPKNSSIANPVIAPSPRVENGGNALSQSSPSNEISQYPQSSNPQPLQHLQGNNAINRPVSSGRHRIVNSKKFQIGYKIEDVGPSGVGQIELFITENDGQKWWKYGLDPDQQTPFHVEVPADGRYGFALRVRSGVGLAESPPQPGEKPSIVVIVDNTAPQAQLMPIQQGQGVSLNKIHIQWRIADPNPAARPVSLSYSASPNGPWEPISGWLENSGSHVWTVGPGAPSKLYVRLTARDAAGNIVRVQSPRPILVDLTKPTARIVDIETITPSPR